MINSVVLEGRLVADPELKATTGGKDVCTFRIAVDRDYVAQGQERQADFISCVVFGNTASFVNNYFSKGSLISGVGSIRTRRYEDKNGEKRTATEVLFDRVSFVGDKKKNDEEDYDLPM